MYQKSFLLFRLNYMSKWKFKLNESCWVKWRSSMQFSSSLISPVIRYLKRELKSWKNPLCEALYWINGLVPVLVECLVAAHSENSSEKYYFRGWKIEHVFYAAQKWIEIFSDLIVDLWELNSFTSRQTGGKSDSVYHFLILFY